MGHHRPPHGLHGLIVPMMRQLNGCSTPSPISSVTKQWLEELAQKMKKLDGLK